MDRIDRIPRKRRSESEAIDNLYEHFIAKKKLKAENRESSSSRNFNGEHSKMGPLQLEMPVIKINTDEMNMRLRQLQDQREHDHPQLQQQQHQKAAFARHQAYLKSLNDDEEEPQKLFTLLDIKDDFTSKKALEARRRLRFTNIHSLIVPEEKLFLITCCDHFSAIYEDLIDYIVAIGEMRNKQIIIEHYYYKFFLHTFKMFYYTEKGWRFEVDFDEFFSGYLRKYREPIIARMRDAWNKAKAARQQNKPAVVEKTVQLPSS